MDYNLLKKIYNILKTIIMMYDFMLLINVFRTGTNTKQFVYILSAQ